MTRESALAGRGADEGAGRGAGRGAVAGVAAVVRMTTLGAGTGRPTTDGVAIGILTPDAADEAKRGLADTARTDLVVAAAGVGVGVIEDLVVALGAEAGTAGRPDLVATGARSART